MPNTIPSQNMGLPVPVVGIDPGPQYGVDLNNCFAILDQHNHTAGSGVLIPPGGLDINADLPFQLNNAIQLRSVRLNPYASSGAFGATASDVGCLLEIGVDLYFYDGNQNLVRITQSGSVAGTPGSIGSLTSPASATYVSANQTFVWQSDVNTPANLDAASVIFRNLTANSKGLTISPPNAMGANYGITLPALPASTLALVMDSAGAMGAQLLTSSQLGTGSVTSTQIAAGAVVTAGIGSGAVTTAKIAAGAVTTDKTTINEVFSSEIATTASTGVYTDITNATVTFTTTGKNVRIELVPSTSNNLSYMGPTGAQDFVVQLLRDGTRISSQVAIPAGHGILLPTVLNFYDVAPAAGSHTYKLQWKGNGGASGLTMQYALLHAIEY